MYIEALKIAYKAHDGDLRKQSCVPYIVHPLRVANCFNDDMKKTVAILHDVIEDTPVTLAKLSKTLNLPKKAVRALYALTKQKDEEHFKYIERVKKNELATEIKLADITDNLSDTLCPVEKSMAHRYNKSFKILLS